MAKGAITRAKTAAKLVEAGLEVFADKGFHAATVADICAHGQVSRGAFYSNFENKDALFFAIFEANASRVLGLLSTLPESTPTDAALGDTIAALIGALSADPEAARRWYVVSVEFRSYAARNAEAAAQLAAHDRSVHDAVTEFIDTTLARHGRPLPRHAAAHLARLLIAIHDGAMLGDLTGDGGTSAALMTQYLLPLIRIAADG